MKSKIREKTTILLLSDSVAMLSSFILALLLGHQAHFTLDLVYTPIAGASPRC